MTAHPTLTAWLLTGLLVGAPVGAAAAAEIVVTPAGIEPRVLKAKTGERVTFVNRAGVPVHVSLGASSWEHEIAEAPGQPLWAVFYRPGTHAFTVHVYGRRVRTLSGVVDVEADETHDAEAATCGVRVGEDCLEP